MRAVFTVQYRELILGLVSRDIKTRYKQSVLGYAWAVLYPLATAFIFSLVGQVIMRAQTGGLPYPIYAYFGLLFWNLFSAGVTASTESLTSHISLITKVYFPREVFPISAVVSKLADFGFGLVGLAPLLVVYRVVPSIKLPLIVLPTLILVLYTVGLGMLFACLNLFWRDVRHLIGIVLSLWTFLVPNIYPLQLVPIKFQALYLLNPVATLTEVARRIAFPQTGWLRAIDPLHGNNQSLWPFIGLALLQSIAVFGVGYTIFKRNEPRFAEFV